MIKKSQNVKEYSCGTRLDQMTSARDMIVKEVMPMFTVAS